MTRRLVHCCGPQDILIPLRWVGTGGGFNTKDRRIPAHPDYRQIQQLWHPTKNRGKMPANFTHGSGKKVWLRCPGCQHGCGRLHQWEARACDLVNNSDGNPVCPKCDSGNGGLCLCRSVEKHPTLSGEWHPGNPHPGTVSVSSKFQAMWICPEGHHPYKARSFSRSTFNQGCPL